MRKEIFQQFSLMVALAILFQACQKDELQTPPPVNNPGGKSIKLKLQAVVSIDSIIYDSIPALFTITSWDAQNQAHQKDTLVTGKGEVSVPDAHLRYQVTMRIWGIQDQMTIERATMDENVTYTLGGAKAAKKLLKEETFLLVQGEYQPQSKAIYIYDGKGIREIKYFQKKPQFADLQLTMTHQYQYTGNAVTRINRTDSANVLFGYTTFDYNPQNTRVANIREVSPAGETGAAVEHGAGGSVHIDYLFSNGHTMTYEMTFRGGNKVQDMASSSRGGSETGSYSYDTNINPYAHISMPNLLMTNMSKNNLTGQQKGYAGAYPIAEPYQFNYTYDSDGYPVELVKYFKNYFTGEFMYQTKTIFSY